MLTCPAGIGLGLTKKFLSEPNTTVIAAVRDPSIASSKALTSLAAGTGSKIIVVKIDGANTDDPESAVKTLTTQHSIDHIDVLLANAGIAVTYGAAIATPMDGFKEHLAINTVAPFALFKAFLPLLEKAPQGKFVALSTIVGSIEEMNQSFNATPYGASKAALNWVMKNLHIEHPNLIIFPIHPGYIFVSYKFPVQEHRLTLGLVGSNLTWAILRPRQMV